MQRMPCELAIPDSTNSTSYVSHPLQLRTRWSGVRISPGAPFPFMEINDLHSQTLIFRARLGTRNEATNSTDQPLVRVLRAEAYAPSTCRTTSQTRRWS